MVRILQIWCICLVFSGAILASSPTQAQSSNLETRANRVVVTHRSDGAIFPAVSQTQRIQRPRKTSVSGSRQALPAPFTWQQTVESPTGGTYVAPAGVGQEDNLAPRTYIQIQPTPLLRKQRPKAIVSN
jgi:hypothetical protein